MAQIPESYPFSSVPFLVFSFCFFQFSLGLGDKFSIELMNPSRSPPGKTHNNAPRGRRGAGELAGGTAAECTAIFCCLPCTVIDIVVQVVYKVPAGICRKAIHTYKRKPQPRALKKNDDVLLSERSSGTGRPSYYMGTTLGEHLASKKEMEKANEGSELREMETEMWAPFNRTGFWRSFSGKAVS